MRVIFAKDRRPISLLIRLVTWSRWHHCAAITPDNKFVIEAKGGVGVVRTPLAEFKSRYKHTAIAVIDCHDQVAFDFLNKQVSKDYDLKAIFGILFRTSWDHGDKWFCSELVAKASGKFRNERMSRVTPEHLWMISHD